MGTNYQFSGISSTFNFFPMRALLASRGATTTPVTLFLSRKKHDKGPPKILEMLEIILQWVWSLEVLVCAGIYATWKLIQWYVYDMMKFFIHPMQEHEGYSKVWSIYIYETRFVHWWIQTVIACKCCITTPLCLGRRPTIDNLPQEVSESHHWNLRFIKARTTTQ